MCFQCKFMSYWVRERPWTKRRVQVQSKGFWLLILVGLSALGVEPYLPPTQKLACISVRENPEWLLFYKDSGSSLYSALESWMSFNENDEKNDGKTHDSCSLFQPITECKGSRVLISRVSRQKFRELSRTLTVLSITRLDKLRERQWGKKLLLTLQVLPYIPFLRRIFSLVCFLKWQNVTGTQAAMSTLYSIFNSLYEYYNMFSTYAYYMCAKQAFICM